MQLATDRRAKLTRHLGQIVKMGRAVNNTSLGVSFYEHDKISPFNTRGSLSRSDERVNSAVHQPAQSTEASKRISMAGPRRKAANNILLSVPTSHSGKIAIKRALQFTPIETGF